MIKEIAIKYKISGLIGSEETILHGLRVKSEFRLGNISGRGCYVKEIIGQSVVIGIGGSNIPLVGQNLIQNNNEDYELKLNVGDEAVLVTSTRPKQRIVIKLLRIEEKTQKYIA